MPKDQTHLLHDDILLVGNRQHFQHQEQAGLIVVEFRPLVGVGNVFKEQ